VLEKGRGALASDHSKSKGRFVAILSGLAYAEIDSNRTHSAGAVCPDSVDGCRRWEHDPTNERQPRRVA